MGIREQELGAICLGTGVLVSSRLATGLLDMGLIRQKTSKIVDFCDYIIDIGPGAGKSGGCIIGEGMPEEIAKLNTPIGRELEKYLSGLWKSL